MIRTHFNRRLKRARKSRAIIARTAEYRLTVHKTSKHIYSQITTSDGSRVVASASSLHKAVCQEGHSTGNVYTSALVGRLIAQEATRIGIVDVAFDRSGFKYHGRIKALADAAREEGLRF
jgi:large subunit ribosomal protein L18